MTFHFPIPLAAVLAVLTLCGCSSTEKSSKSDSGTGKKLSERMSMKEWNPKHRSSFEKQVGTSGKAKNVKTDSFHTREYTARSASGTVDKKFKGKEFAQADKKDTSMEKSFSGAHESSRMGTEQFKTSESHLADKTSHDATRMSHESDKTFSGSSQTFRTTKDAIGAKALTKAPKDKSIDTSKVGYTEDEVRAMLNKR